MSQSVCIIQARMGSTRLPGKVLMKVGGITVLEYTIKRIQRSKKINKIVVATTNEKEDDAIVAHCKKIGVDCFRGSTEDVLARYWHCALKYPAYDIVVRLTGDCPLNDPIVIDKTILLLQKGKYDFASTRDINRSTFPDGIVVEVFTRNTLEETYRNAKLFSEREHVTLYMRKNGNISKATLDAPEDNSRFRVTIDNPEDFEVLKFLIEYGKNTDPYEKFILLLKEYPEVAQKNMHIGRDEGMIKSLREDREVDVP